MELAETGLSVVACKVRLHEDCICIVDCVVDQSGKEGLYPYCVV